MSRWRCGASGEQTDLSYPIGPCSEMTDIHSAAIRVRCNTLDARGIVHRPAAATARARGENGPCPPGRVCAWSFTRGWGRGIWVKNMPLWALRRVSQLVDANRVVARRQSGDPPTHDRTYVGTPHDVAHIAHCLRTAARRPAPGRRRA